MKDLIEKNNYLMVAAFAFFLPISTTLCNLILIYLLIFWIFNSTTIKEKLKYLNNIIFYPIYILVLFFILGTIYTKAPVHDVTNSLQKISKLLYIPILIYYLQDNNDKKEKDRKKCNIVIYSFLAGIAFIIFLAVIKKYTDPNILQAISPTEIFKKTFFTILRDSNPTTIFKNTLDTSMLVCFAIFILLHEWCSEFHSYSVLKKILLTLCILTAIYYLFFCTVGRTGQVLGIFLIILFIVQVYKYKGLIISCIAVPLILVFLYYNSPLCKNLWYQTYVHYKNYQAKTVNSENTSLGQRVDFTLNSLRIIKKKPIFGYGTGSFKYVYNNYAREHNITATNNPHNEYLNIWLQIGVLGLLSLTFVFLSLLKMSIYLDAKEKYLLQGIVILISVGSLANSWIMDFTSGYLFVLFVAISLSNSKKLS